MHPLALWLISASQLRERDSEDRLMRRQREARTREAERVRDGRWASTMHRWASPDRGIRSAQAQSTPLPAATSAAATATTLGCATA